MDDETELLREYLSRLSEKPQDNQDCHKANKLDFSGEQTLDAVLEWKLGQPR